MSDFVHLHLHSEYSLLDGACRIADIPRRVKECGHTSVAITDHGVMYGAVAFYNACKKEGIKPIIGCEVYLARRTRFDRDYAEDSSSFHLVLLCKNEVGYKNLIHMVTLAFSEGFYSKPRIDMELLEKHHEGLIALSACLGGFIPSALMKGDYDSARAHAEKMRSIFGEDYYLEIQDHGLEEQKAVNAQLVRLSRELSIPLVATNDAHYLRRADADSQAILMCIQTNSVITDGRPIGFETDEFYYKTTEEMRSLFSHLENEPLGSPIANTVKIADKCNFDFDFSKIYLPTFTPPEGQASGEYLRKLAYEGLSRRIDTGRIFYDEAHPEREYIERLEYEISVILKMGYEDYFLIVADFVGYAKKNSIPVGPGRGSGAGSLVAFLLEITDLDPLRFDLLFERFLNPERVSMPDFDIDFCYNRRDEVLEYVKNRYGEDHVAQIITFGTMAARAVVRDVGRALGMSYSDVDAVAKSIPHALDITLKRALEESKELREMYDDSEVVRRLVDTAAALEGMPRHASTHAAGVVITDRPVSEYVPLAMNGGALVTQFDMDTVAKLGLLKFDFLALRYLTIISDTEKQIREHTPDFSVEAISLDDKPTYELISSGSTGGIFQLESGGMRQVLTQLRPDGIEDIISVISLYRPGPMDSIPKYIENRKNPEKTKYKTPLLAPILDVTYGCMVYQEQVMQVCRTVAGYSFGRADLVRRFMAKKDTEKMEKEREVFVAGAEKNGISAEIANGLFDEMSSFASYAFNKSHAAAYSIISYRTAYLKCHYPCEYFAALLTSVMGNTVKTAEYVAECAKYGIRLLTPNINESTADFHAVSKNGEKYVRFGILALKNIGEGFIERIMEEREGNPFKSFEDFVSRMYRKDMNKRQLEALIKCGAFDELGIFRSRLLASYEKIVDHYQERSRSNVSGQLDMFSMLDSDGFSGGFSYPELPELTLREKLRLEKECAGLYFSGHMLEDYSKHIEKIAPDKIGSVIESFSEEGSGSYTDRQTVTLCAIVSRRQNKMTKNGAQMAFVNFEDRYGEMEGIIFPKVLEAVGHILSLEAAVCVKGQISQRDDEEPKIIVETAYLLEDNNRFKESVSAEKNGGVTTDGVVYKVKGVRPPPPAVGGAVPAYIPTAEKPRTTPEPTKIYLRVESMAESDNGFKKAKNLVEIFSDGKVEVIFFDKSSGQYKRMGNVGLYVSPTVVNELKMILGEENVVLK